MPLLSRPCSRRPPPRNRARSRICAGATSGRRAAGASPRLPACAAQPCTYYMGATGGGVWKTETCGADWTPISDGQIETGSIGCDRRRRVQSRHRLGRHRQRRDPQQRDHRPRRLQVRRRRPHLAVHGPEGRRPDRQRRRAPDQPRRRVARRARLAVRAERRARHLQDDRRRQDLEEDAVRQRRDRRPRRRGQLRPTPTSSMPACIAASARAGTSFPEVPRREGGIYKSVDGGETWTKLSSGLPSTLIGKIDIGVARSQPSHGLRDGGGARQRRRAVQVRRCRRVVEARERRGEPAHAAVLLPLRRRQSEGRRTRSG